VFALRDGAKLIVMLAAMTTGCGQRSGQGDTAPAVDAQGASFHTPSPRQYLEAVFARYRNATSYHDRGVVKLEYRVGNSKESKIAPMHVWLDRNQVYVEAYDVRLWSDAKFLTAWVSDPQSSDFDSQVVRVPSLAGRPTLKALLADPILAERIAAGLAGPPPQLDWLFAKQPMNQLFQPEHQFEFGQARSIDGRLCRGVRVTAGPDLYQFWVDESIGAIREVQLPAIIAPPAPGQPPQTMSLSLVLTDPSFDAPKWEPDIKPLTESPVYVRRFVPLPPPQPPRVLGSRPAAFRLVDNKRQLTLTNRDPDRELTILVRFSGDRQSLHSMAAIERWSARMPDSLRRRVRVAVLADPQAGVPEQVTLAVVRDPGRLAPSLDLAPGSLLILDRNGLVAWAQGADSLASPESLVTLGAIVGDILDGVDVPGRIRDQWKEQVTQYRLFLSRESAHRK
jgi:hypothetical protein